MVPQQPSLPGASPDVARHVANDVERYARNVTQRTLYNELNELARRVRLQMAALKDLTRATIAACDSPEATIGHVKAMITDLSDKQAQLLLAQLDSMPSEDAGDMLAFRSEEKLEDLYQSACDDLDIDPIVASPAIRVSTQALSMIHECAHIGAPIEQAQAAALIHHYSELLEAPGVDHTCHYIINISEEAYQAILSAARHRFGGRYRDIAKWINIIFDTGVHQFACWQISLRLLENCLLLRSR